MHISSSSNSEIRLRFPLVGAGDKNQLCIMIIVFYGQKHLQKLFKLLNNVTVPFRLTMVALEGRYSALLSKWSKLVPSCVWKKSSCYFFWNFCLECRTFTCVNFFTTSRATICSKTVCRYGFSINVNLSLSRCQTSTLVSSSAVAEIWKRSSAATPNHSGESTKWSRGTTWSNLPDCLTKKLAKEQTIKKMKAISCSYTT